MLQVQAQQQEEAVAEEKHGVEPREDDYLLRDFLLLFFLRLVFL